MAEGSGSAGRVSQQTAPVLAPGAFDNVQDAVRPKAPAKPAPPASPVLSQSTAGAAGGNPFQTSYQTAATGAAGPSGQSTIWLGTRQVNPDRIDAIDQGKAFNAGPSGDKTASLDEMVTALYGMSPDNVRDLQQRMAAAGFYKGAINGVATTGFASAYAAFLGTVASMQGAGNMVTPDQVLAQGANKGVSGQEKITRTQVDLSDPETAASLINKAGQDWLGRDVSPADRLKLAAGLRAYEAAHPTNVTQGTVDYSGGYPMEKTTNSVSGLNGLGEAQYAADAVKALDGKESGSVLASRFFEQALQNVGAVLRPVNANG